MELPKDKIIELLRSRGENDKADRANDELPDQVDTDKHGDLLASSASTPGRCSAASATRSASEAGPGAAEGGPLMATRDNPEERK